MCEDREKNNHWWDSSLRVPQSIPLEKQKEQIKKERENVATTTGITFRIYCCV
jgi:hypothetical protein